MGMFDHVKCLYPLPNEKHNGLDFQTKSLESLMDNYEIRPDGTLWIETYDVEDQSDPKAEGLMRIVGCMTRINQEWVQCQFTGELEFRAYDGGVRLSYRAVFLAGKMRSLRAYENNAFDGANLMKTGEPT